MPETIEELAKRWEKRGIITKEGSFTKKGRLWLWSVEAENRLKSKMRYFR